MLTILMYEEEYIMICPKCGSQTSNDAIFCEICGALITEGPKPLVEEKSHSVIEKSDIIVHQPPTEGIINSKSLSKRKLIIIIALTILLAAIILVVLILANSGSHAKVNNYLVEAEKYLIEMNYEQAIIAFDKALEIDPNNSYAYIGKAEALKAMGKDAEAIEMLEKGYEVTGDERVAEKLKKYDNNNSFSSSSGSSVSSSSSSAMFSESETNQPKPQETGIRYISISDECNGAEEFTVSQNILHVRKNDGYSNYYIDKNLNLSFINPGEAGSGSFISKYFVFGEEGNWRVAKANKSGIEIIKQSAYPMLVSQNGYIAYYSDVGSNHIVITIESPLGQTVSSTRIPDPYEKVYVGFGAEMERLKFDYPHDCFVYEKKGVNTGTSGFYIFGEDGSVITPDELDVDDLYYLSWRRQPEGEIYVHEYKRSFEYSFPEFISQSGEKYTYYLCGEEYYNLKSIVSYYKEGAVFYEFDGSIEDSTMLRYAIGDISTSTVGKLYKNLSTYDGKIFTTTDENGKMGYIDENGNQLMTGLDYATDFCGDYSVISEHGEYYLINRNFEKLQKIDGTDVKAWDNNFFTCVRNNRVYLIEVGERNNFENTSNPTEENNSSNMPENNSNAAESKSQSSSSSKLVSSSSRPVISTSKPVSSSNAPVDNKPGYGSMGSVTIKNEKYDIATTTKLVLDYNSYSDDDIIQLGKLVNLTFLEIKYHIDDLSPLANLTNLTYLDLSWNDISDLSPLSNLKKLTHLDLFYNGISDITPLANLTNLTYLNLGYNQINDITPLSRLTKLTELNICSNDDNGIYRNTIEDLTPIQTLTKLKKLVLYNNNISDITPLSNLTNLKELRLDNVGRINRGNQISDITPLSNLTNLTLLKLGAEYRFTSGNKISDLSPLANLTNLTELDLSLNQISDVTPIRNLVNLTDLDLRRNQVDNVAPLANLSSLRNLSLYENDISAADKEWLKNQLPNCNISF